MRNLEGEIEDRAPERLQAMPLLNVVLGLEIPDNDFTKTLEPQYRKSALTALFEDCLRAAAKDEPLLIVIEDMHWIDALSHDLLEELGRALNDSRVCFVLAYRPPQLARLEAPRLEAMPNFTKIELRELNQAEAESAIRAKLAQLYPARGGALPSGLVQTLMARAGQPVLSRRTAQLCARPRARPCGFEPHRTARQSAHADPQPHRPVERAREDHLARGEHRRAFVPRRVADGVLSRIGWNESRAI